LPEIAMSDVIGWGSAAVLLLTVSAQVLQQWKSRSSAGVSPWLFIGQITASAGFVAYSIAVGDAVFTATNTLLLLAAILGQVLYLRNRCAERRRGNGAEHLVDGGTPATSLPP